MKKNKKLSYTNKYSLKLMLVWVGVFAAIGAATLLLTKAATPGIAVIVDSTLPNPTNVKAYADDRVATIAWTPVANPSAQNIIGYYVTWGSGSTYTNARQTEYNSIQIQPLTNGTLYNVKVQAVKGSEVTVPTPGAHDSESATERRANGKVSTGVTTTVTASSARVDALRTQMTGFFDDFNTPAGAFDETKWNVASSTCVPPSETGAFINNQFHAHSQARSSYGNFTYCDRGQSITRPRGIFNTTGRTESNPGVLTFDFDGVTHGRDKWYIDLIPVSARKTGAPLDLTSHASIEDDDISDPAMLRISQTGSLQFDAFGNDKKPEAVNMLYTACPDFAGNLSLSGDWCGGNFGAPVPGLSPLPELPIDQNHPGAVPNVRRHWRVEISSTKIKMYLDSVKMLEGEMPANLAGVTQWYVQNNIFTYNTGKLDNTNPTTSILHWDNFGWNGPSQNAVIHNYLDGGVDGTVPYIARGTLTNETGDGNRSLKINVPDPIASPVKARLMFTFGAYGFQSYNWQNGDSIIVNGKTYPYADPAINSMQPPMATDHLADTSMNYSDSIAINPSDLKQGMNDVQLKLVHNSGNNVINVHLELEYTKGSEPTYTQPTAIFTAAKLLSAIQPTMASHDSYLFIEQDFGLPSGALDSTTPVNPPPTSGDTTKPTVVLNAPTDNTTVTSGGSFTATASASDNVGVTKVEFYVGNTLKFTDTTPPFTTSISTVGLAPASYGVVAVAYDAAGNTANSATSTIVIPQPPDNTKPSVSIISPVANAQLNGASASIQAAADDASGISKVDFFVDGTMISSDTSAPYSAALDTTKLTNSVHSLMARAYDTAGNSQDSSAVSVTVNNTAADTTNPTVSISAPLANATITGKLAFIQATASDAGGISKVEFYINGTLLGTDTAAPYSFTLDSTLYTNGTYNLTAKAYDNSNNVNTSSVVSVNIANPDTTLPSVVITAPFNGVTIAGSYTVSATAADAGGIARVDFSVDSGAVLSSDTTSPYSYSLDTTKLTNAAHSIKVTAYDVSNNSNWATANITVNNAVATPVAKKCDFNNSGTVDTDDLFILLANFNKTVPGGTKGDCSGDGLVDINDLFFLLGSYGK